MTTIYGERGRGSGRGQSRYYEMRDELNDYFNSGLSTNDRAAIVLNELAPVLLLSLGYLLASLFLNAFIGIAWAQQARVFGLNHHEWSMAVYLAYNAVIIAILAILIMTIVQGSKSQWAWRTASFLLGFLVKSVSTVPTF